MRHSSNISHAHFSGAATGTAVPQLQQPALLLTNDGWLQLGVPLVGGDDGAATGHLRRGGGWRMWHWGAQAHDLKPDTAAAML